MRSAHRATALGIVAIVCLLLGTACFAGVARASVDYLSASFVDAKYGWIAGIDSMRTTDVWRTTDGGVTWKKAGSGVAAGGSVGWVAFVSRTAGVWGNGGFLRTGDGGGSWEPVAVSDLGIVNEACFATPAVGWAASTYGNSAAGGALAKTTDGGLTWVTQKSLPGDDGSGGFSRVSSPSVQQCYAFKWGDEGGVWATSDGGAVWTRRPLPAIAGGAYAYYWDIDFPAAGTGWAVGDGGTIVKTVNGGGTWATQSSGVSAQLTAVDFVSASVGFAVGKGGLILRTRDGGTHWVKLSSGTQKRLSAVCFVSASRGWVVGTSGVRLRTANGGRTWLGQH